MGQLTTGLTSLAGGLLAGHAVMLYDGSSWLPVGVWGTGKHGKGVQCCRRLLVHVDGAPQAANKAIDPLPFISGVCCPMNKEVCNMQVCVSSYTSAMARQ